jgi:hypothetical protein
LSFLHFIINDWWEIKLTALDVTFKSMKLIIRENWSAGSREEVSGIKGVLKI